MKKFAVILVLSVLLISSLFAEDGKVGQYEMGSQIFTFRAGAVIPLFFYRPYADSDTFLSFDETHMNVGGYGSIRYQGFITNSLALGGELGYFFAYSQSDLFTTVPLQAKLTYIPLQGTFEIPLSIGLGGAYNSYGASRYFSLFGSAEAGFSWFFSENWGITLSAGFQMIPELYGKDNEKWKDTTYAAFLPITLSVSYRQ